jgi:lipopolysaccharide/colanic/teichoic acid biosynthesis glycosyltransferase
MTIHLSDRDIRPTTAAAALAAPHASAFEGAGFEGAGLQGTGFQGTGAAGFYARRGKRLLDLVLVILAAPVAVPLILVLAALVALEGGRPFYSQMRVGRGGAAFRMWKLRTMVQEADALLAGHLARDPEARREWDATQKLKRDPRITRMGRILRKTSLDELPQLWNVLNGTMSLVGPRPMMLSQRALYASGFAYFRLRPGITGAWQVSDRNDSDFVDRVRHDDAYERGLSLAADLRILAATVRVVLRGTGY